jgi:transcription antitermination factor NusB
MRKRTQAREIALQALYQQDIQRKAGEPAPAGVEGFEIFIQGATDDPEVRDYARRLLDGSLANIEEIDRRIAATATHWKLQRIAVVDRCVLRLALFELLECPEVPPKVVINEAVELAKKYSTEQSGAFVNGILDTIYGETRST